MRDAPLRQTRHPALVTGFQYKAEAERFLNEVGGDWRSLIWSFTRTRRGCWSSAGAAETRRKRSLATKRFAGLLSVPRRAGKSEDNEHFSSSALSVVAQYPAATAVSGTKPAGIVPVPCSLIGFRTRASYILALLIALTLLIQDKSRMRECRPYGSVRGCLKNVLVRARCCIEDEGTSFGIGL